MNTFEQSIATMLANANYATRRTVLSEIIQNMNERAESSQDMSEIALFIVAQLGGDAAKVIEGHCAAQRKKRA